MRYELRFHRISLRINTLLLFTSVQSLTFLISKCFESFIRVMPNNADNDN